MLRPATPTTFAQPQDLDDPFDMGLAGVDCRLDRDGCHPIALNTRRWHSAATRSDRWLLDGCRGPTVDLGCGPGRLVAALTERGVLALGVDSSPRAIEQCARRGAMALQRDVFDPLPEEGRWHHALLADGNIGIGGDPVALLRRVRELLRPGGSALVELSSDEPGLWQGSARLAGPGALYGQWFPWAMVGVSAITQVASAAELSLLRVRARRRPFAELGRA